MLDWLARLMSRKVRTSSVAFTGHGQTRSMPNNARAYSVEGYGQNVVVFRCVDVLAKAVATIPLRLRDPSGELHYEHDVLTLLANPNPVQSGAQLIETLVAFRLITGNAYLEALRTSDNAPPGELWSYVPFHFTVGEPARGFIPVGYVYDDGQPMHRKAWTVDQVTGDSDLLHWRTFNPNSPWFGMSPIAAGATGVDQHNIAGQWNKNLLGNNAAPSGALVTEQTLTPDQFAQLKMELETTYQGAQNAKRPMLLEGGLTWQQFSLSPQDMDWLNGKLSSAQDIAAAFGVPLQVIPLPGSQTFANYGEARLALYEDTAIPLLQDLLGSFDRWLLPMFGLEGWTLEGDLDEVAALASRRAEKWTAVNTSTVLTINEKREALGYEPLDDPSADIVMVAAGQVPLGFDGGEMATAGDEPVEATPAAIADATADGANVAATALNGAQITSLTSTLTAVSQGQFSAEVALLMLQEAFPLMDPAKIQRMVASAAKFTPDPVAQPTAL